MMLSSRGTKFATLLGVLQALFILLMGLFGDYKDRNKPSDIHLLANFQDTNTMIFVGIGFLLTFLKNYAFTSLGMNLLIGVICVQWSAIVDGFIAVDIMAGERFEYGILGMADGLFTTATVLISFCGVLGQVNPTQAVVMGLMEIVFAQTNKYIGMEYIKAKDQGDAMFIHMFAAYFGIAVARVLYKPKIEEAKKEVSLYHNDLFSMLGTLILWVYWPTFNGGFDDTETAAVNTFLSLCACTVMTFALSRLMDSKGSFDMMYLQNATLAGGVSMGACCNMPMKPYAAMLIGSIGGLMCNLGYTYLTPALTSRINIHDTCGIHNLHGIPGWVSVFASAGLAGTASFSKWGPDFYEIFPEARSVNGTISDWTPAKQAGYQIAAACVTTVFAVISGLFTGHILNLSIWKETDDAEFFDDRALWKIPEGFPGVETDSDQGTPMETIVSGKDLKNVKPTDLAIETKNVISEIDKKNEKPSDSEIDKKKDKPSDSEIGMKKEKPTDSDIEMKNMLPTDSDNDLNVKL